MICKFCGVERPFPCMNTRDMTDAAIYGNNLCYVSLKDEGGGEQGMRYVDLNRERIRQLQLSGDE